MSIEAQLDRLNTNLESLVGAIAANTSVASALANASAAPTPQAEKPTPAAPKKTATKPKEEVKAEAPAPVAEPAPVVAQEATQADTDPFADDVPDFNAPTYTLDDVREVSVKLVNAIGIEKGRALVSSFNVASLKELPAAHYADFIGKATKLIGKGTL